MQKNFKGYIFFFLTLAALLGSVFAAGFVFAIGQTTSTLRGSGSASAKPAIAPMVSTHTVNMRDVPAATTRSLSNPTKIEPWHEGVSSTIYTHRKELNASMEQLRNGHLLLGLGTQLQECPFLGVPHIQPGSI